MLDIFLKDDTGQETDYSVPAKVTFQHVVKFDFRLINK